MLKVNNKKTIRKISKTSFKANKMRNIFVVIAIVLTTVLFTALFTITASLLTSMQESTMRQIGTGAHGAFKYLTSEQYDNLKVHPTIKNISYSVVLGVGENKELTKRPSEIRYVKDELGAKNKFALPTTGRLPQNDGELATDKIVLKRLGIPAKLGEKVTLEYSLGGEKHTDTFTLVGFWEGDILISASQIWLNRSYVETQLENYLSSDENEIIGTINADVNFFNSINIEGKLLKILRDSGYHKDDIQIGVNWAYTGNSGSVDIGTILGGVLVISMIVFCGYLIISNIFYISIANDIRFFGLLKTIGTTGKQIRFLIRRQALLLCAVGIPLGLFAGAFVGAFLVPIVLSILNVNIINISISPLVFLASALFALSTVFISIAKPSKMAARLSPIVALRSSDATQKSKKFLKKSKDINVWNMAQGNVFRNKKKVVLVTISLSLSLIILNMAYSMANSFDMDTYLKLKIGSDFAVGDVSNFNVFIHYSNQKTLNSTFLNQLSAKEGMETISNIYFSEPSISLDPRLKDLPERVEKILEIDGNQLMGMKDTVQSEYLINQHIYGIDENALDKLTIFEGELDFKKLKTGKYVIAACYDPEGKLKYYEVGDKVSIGNAEGSHKEYEVLALANIPYNISNQHQHPITPEFYLPSDVFLRDIEKKEPMLTTFDVKDSHEAQMERYLLDYCENTDTNMNYESKATLAAECENTKRTYKSVGLILSLLVAFIGVMNFINTVVTSITSRRQELAMLQSIGMTNGQMQRMLSCEGIVYTALTAIFALTIGSVLGYFAVGAFTNGSLYFILQFTVLPSLVCLPILAIISVAVPYFSQKMLTKNSVVERLRETE